MTFGVHKSEGGLAWSSYILPFIDQAPLWNEVASDALGAMGRTPTDADLKGAILTTFRCPSDIAPGLNDQRGSYATSNYIASSGHDRTLFDPTISSNIPTGIPGHGTGVFYPNSKVRLRDVTDGPSNTILIGEIAYGQIEPTGVL